MSKNNVVGEEGLEPPVSERADLQSARLPVTGYSPNLKKLFLIALSIIMFIQESSEYFKFTTIDSCRNNTYDFIWITLLQIYSFNLLDNKTSLYFKDLIVDPVGLEPTTYSL